MRKMKQLLASILVIVFACSMLTAGVFAEEAAAPADTQAQAEEAAVKADPIEGSWVLYEVYEVKENAEPVLLKKEENQSLYGSGIGIYTFEDGGSAHHNMIDGGDNLDEEASWESAEPGVYAYTEGSENLTFLYVEQEDMLHRMFAEEGRSLDFVYARAMVGSWKLDQVMEIHEGDAPVDLPKEENQSLYGSGESILSFEPNGNACDEIIDGSDRVVTEASWELTAPDQFTYTEDTLEMEFSYFRVDDTIFRDYKEEAPDAAHPHLRFTYVRVFPEPEAEEETTKAAQAETRAAAQSATQPAPQPAPQPATNAADTNKEDELIADGQIFSGRSLTLYDPDDSNRTMVVDELNQGGWADQTSGKIYYQAAGGSLFFTGEDNSSWVLPEYFEQEEEEELINGGQIFTGFEMNLYDPDTGEVVTVKELSQGGYADEATGEIYTQEGGGGDHFYGDHGSVLITEWLYYNSNDDIDDIDDADDVYDDSDYDDGGYDDGGYDDGGYDDDGYYDDGDDGYTDDVNVEG